MTLLEIRTELIKQSGRYDLVSSPTTFADNGANYFIQQAQRFLDRKLDTRYNKAHYRKQLILSDTVFVLPGFRVVDRVFLYGNGSELELRKRAKEYLFKMYDDPDNIITLDRTRPIFYAEVPYKVVDDRQKYGAEEITNGAFATTLSGWTVDLGTIVWNAGHAYHPAGVEDLMYQTTLVSGLTYRVQARVYRKSSEGTVTFSSGANLFTQSGSGTVKQSLVAASTQFTITFSANFDGWVDDVSVQEITNEFEADFLDGDMLSFPVANDYTPNIGIIIRGIPTEDSTWTLVVEGLAYATALTADTSVSYWSDQHPQTLIDATRMYLERVRRNQAGRRDMLSVIDDDLETITFDDVQAEVAEFNHIENFNE